MKQKNRIAALLLSAVFLVQCALPVWAEDTIQETLPDVGQFDAGTSPGVGVQEGANENAGSPNGTEESGEGEPDVGSTGEGETNGGSTGGDETSGDSSAEDEPNSDYLDEGEAGASILQTDDSGEDGSDGILEEPEEEDPPAPPAWYDPDETEYQLDSAEMLAELAQLSAWENFAGKTITLACDLSGVVLTAPIGTEENPFQGTFDGGWHTVAFDQSQAAPCGLFGVMENAEVSNLRLSGLHVVNPEAGSPYFGALSAGMTGTTVNQVWLEHITLEGSGNGGAMTGRAEDCRFFGCAVSDLEGDPSAYVYMWGAFGTTSLERCYAIRFGDRENAEHADSWPMSENCVRVYDGFFGDACLGFTGCSDQTFAVYLLNRELEEPLWAIEDGVAAPRGFLTEAAKAPVQVSVVLEGNASKGILTVNGRAARGYYDYLFAGDQLTLDYHLPDLPFQAEAEFRCSDPEGFVPLEEGGWLYTCTGREAKITVSLNITGGYDISWYLNHKDEGAFYISTPDQLVGLSLLVSGDVPEVSGPVSFAGTAVYLMNDVTLPTNWPSIGSDSAPFSGSFESLNPAPEKEAEPEEEGGETPEPVAAFCTVTLSDAPLFGTLEGARVANLRLVSEESLNFSPLAQTAADTEFENCAGTAEVSFFGYTGTGGLVGSMTGGRMVSCSVSGSVSGGSNTGGLAGRLSGTELIGCTVSGSVSGSSYVGGLAGQAYGSKFISCTNSSGVSGTSSYVGGIAGSLSSSELTDCANSGQVYTAGNYVGGLAGGMQIDSRIRNSGNTGVIGCGAQYAGGIVGYVNRAAVENCRNEGQVSGTGWVGGVAGYVTGGQLTGCENKSSKIIGSSCAGGVVGSAMWQSILTDCSNTSETLTAEGGVAGQVQSSALIRCSNSAAITGEFDYIGGIAGRASTVTAQDCVNTGAVSSTDKGTSVSGGFGQLDGMSSLTGCENTGNITGLDTASGIACISHVGYSAASIRLDAVNCVNRGDISGGEIAGGLFSSVKRSSGGISLMGSVVHCTNCGDVTAANVAGGIISFGYRLTINSCRNDGDITLGTGASIYYIKSAGGITGHSQEQVSECLNTGTVSAPVDAVALSGVGGIIGTAEGNGRARGCLNLGQVSGSSPLYTGAVTGSGYERNYNCYSGPAVFAYPSDSEYVTILTQEQLASGEGAWLLNKSAISGWGLEDGHPVPAWNDVSAIRKLTVSISGSGTVSGVPESLYLPEGTQFSLTPTPDEGMMITRFRFDNEDLRGLEVPEEGLQLDMPSHDCALEVQFGVMPTQETCTVTFDPRNGEEPTVQTVQAGEDVPCPETEPQWAGHTFQGWYTQPAGGEVYSFDEAVTTDLTLYAHWSSDDDVTVYFHINGGDVRTVTAERGTEIDAPQVELPDVVVDGIRFSTSQLTGWVGNNGYIWDGKATPMNDWQNYLHLWPQWETKDCLLETAQEGPVEFTTAAQLAQLAKNVAAGESYAGCQFILTQDVTLTGNWRTPIGSYDSDRPFSGGFCGNNGARIILDGAFYPLFGYLGEDAQVSGLTVTGTATQILSDSGGLVMWNGGSVSNITAENLTLGHVYTERIGGIVCWNLPTGVVEECTLSGSAISGRAVGGIVSTNGGTVSNCETDGASMVETGGNVGVYIGNTDYNSGCCLVLVTGGIVGTNIRGTVEDCQNNALINANGTYSVAGGVVGICRDAIDGGYVSEEKTVVWGERGFLRNCTNQGSIRVSAEYPIVGGVLGMYSDIAAPFTADTISGVANTADIQVKNTGSDTELRNYAAVGGVIGKLRAIYCLDWDTREMAAITGLTHNGSISAENCNGVGGILGGSYNCYVILRDCVARGSITSRDTDYAGGIFGCGEFLTAYTGSFMFDGDHGEILIDRCTAELDIRTEGTVKFAGGVAASREEREKVDNIYAYFNSITITDSGHFGVLTAPEGTWDGVCPVNCEITRSWHGSETEALVVTDSASENGRCELPAEAMTSGEAAWLLDGGEGRPLGIWTQGDKHPVMGQPSLRRISAQSSENGSVTVKGASTAYAAIGSTIQVSAQPSSAVVEQDGVKYCYVLENVTLIWTDGEGNIRETDVTDSMSLTVPDENAFLTARFTLEELPPEKEPEKEPEEQPDIGTGGGTGGGTGSGSGTGDTGTGDGDTGVGTGTGEEPVEDPAAGTGTTDPETPGEPGNAQTDTPAAEGTPDVPQVPEEQETTDLPVPPPEEPDAEIPDNIPPLAGMDITGTNPAVNPITPAGAGAAGGQGETPPIFELVPVPLREPHVAAVLLGLLALVAAGALWQSRKYRKDR